MTGAARTSRTPGSVLASQRFDAAIEDGIAERPAPYPNGAVFVGADLPGLGEIIARNASEDRAVVLVYPDGEEWIVEPRLPRPRSKRLGPLVAVPRSMKISIGPYVFDNISYDAEADVLYLHIGEPSTAVDFDESPEGHALRFDAEGLLVGITILGVKRLVERYETVKITLSKVICVEEDAIASVLVVG